MARFEVIVQHSRELASAVNNAYGLHTSIG